MTQTNEQIQALRDKFETAVMKKICISKSTLIGLRTDEGYRNSTLSGHDYQGDWEFFLAGYSCSLAERDADKALIAEQAKRIAELEASLKNLRESMAAIHNTIRLDGAGVSLSVLLSASKRAYEESAAAADITLVAVE